ncbi:MAG: glycosyl transferase family 2 [Terriglobia bacterium]
MIFQMAERLQAKACIVVDSDLRSITPEWIDSLGRPILMADYEFVAPYYYRHKYDGTITNSIVYPLTRSLYGLDLRQPIGGDFAISSSLVSRYLRRKDWETDVARYGIDVWMSTIAMAEQFRVCQSFLGAKLHDTKDPGSDLSAMLHQVVGSVFTLMLEYESVWKRQTGSESVDLFGFRFGVGLDPIPVDVGRLLKSFQSGCQNLGEIWALALQRDTYAAIQKKGESLCRAAEEFVMEDELWVHVVHDFSVAFKNHPLERGYLMRSLTPLYLAKVASFVMEMESLLSAECEERIEKLCLCFEGLKPDLISHWNGEIRQTPYGAAGRGAPDRKKLVESSMGV